MSSHGRTRLIIRPAVVRIENRMSDQRRAVRDGYDQLASEYDAGCGAGRPVAEILATDRDLVGLDFSAEQLRMARERVPARRFVQGDMTALPLAAESFDGIAAYHSVIHVPTDEHPDVVREFFRVLRPGGHLLLTVGASEWDGTNDDWLDTGVEMRWSIPAPDESERLLESAGFEVIWRRVVNDELGDDTGFVLARKPE